MRFVSRPICRRRGKDFCRASIKSEHRCRHYQHLCHHHDVSRCDVAGCMSCSSILRDLQLFLSFVSIHTMSVDLNSRPHSTQLILCVLWVAEIEYVYMYMFCCLTTLFSFEYLQRSSCTIFAECLVNVCKIASLLPGFASDELLNS